MYFSKLNSLLLTLSKNNELKCRSAINIINAPDKIGNVNNNIVPVINKDHGNNGIIFNIK